MSWSVLRLRALVSWGCRERNTLTEEFTSVYRLHPTIPDFLAMYDADVLSQGQVRQFSGRELEGKVPGMKTVQDQIAIVDTVREGSKRFIRGIGIDSIALSFGLTGCGQLTLGNFPRFMTELTVPHAPGGKARARRSGAHAAGAGG